VSSWESATYERSCGVPEKLARSPPGKMPQKRIVSSHWQIGRPSGLTFPARWTGSTRRDLFAELERAIDLGGAVLFR
jgi:hypothetical protein